MKVEATVHMRKVRDYELMVEMGHPRKWHTCALMYAMPFAEMFGEELLARLTRKWLPVKVTLEVDDE